MFQVLLFFIITLMPIILVNSKDEKRVNGVMLINCILFTILLYSIRESGNDFDSYLIYYRDAVNESNLYNYEIGFRILNKSISFLSTVNEEFIFIIYFSIINLFLFAGLRKYLKGKFEVFIFFAISIVYMLNPMNTLIRQYIAIAIFIFSSKYIIEKRIDKFIFFVILASLFHSSAIFVIITYFIVNIRDYKIWKIILSVSGFVFFIVPIVIYIFNKKYVTYINNVKNLEGNSIGIFAIFFMIMIIIHLFFIINNKYIYSKSEGMVIGFSLVYLFLIIVLGKYGYAQRMAFYFQPFLCIAYSYLIRYFKREEKIIISYLLYTPLVLMLLIQRL